MNFLQIEISRFLFVRNRQQAKLFEERMSNVFGGVEGAPSGDQINLTFQKMAGMIYSFKIHYDERSIFKD